MSKNSSSASTAISWPLIISSDASAKFSVAFNFAIIPSLSAVGICGNVMSMFLLARQGFRKSSNVLLFALALADVLYLAGINNFSLRVEEANDPVGYTFSENINYMFYFFYMLQLAAHYIGVFCSVLIPVLITGERLLVIFLPLKTHTIVTPLRTLLVISFVSALVIACFTYEFLLCFRFEHVLVKGVLVGRVVPTQRLYQDISSGAYMLFTNILNYATGAIPLILVILGCSVIGLKVTIITRRRLQLTSGGVTSKNKPSSRKVVSRSSRTLTKICLLYISCRSFGFIVVYVITIPALEDEGHLRNVLDTLNTVSQCINSVGNFIIYVAANNNFRYQDLRTRCLLMKRRR